MLLPQHTCSSTRCVRTSLHSQVITVAAISEKLKVNGSLARRSIDELVKRGLIKCVARHSAQRIYTKVCVRMDDLVVPSFHAPVPVVVPSQFQLGPMANVRVLFSHPFPNTYPCSRIPVSRSRIAPVSAVTFVVALPVAVQLPISISH